MSFLVTSDIPSKCVCLKWTHLSSEQSGCSGHYNLTKKKKKKNMVTGLWVTSKLYLTFPNIKCGMKCSDPILWNFKSYQLYFLNTSWIFPPVCSLAQLYVPSTILVILVTGNIMMEKTDKVPALFISCFNYDKPDLFHCI